MSKKDTSLDDIAQSVQDLGTMISKEFETVKGEQKRQGVLLEDAIHKFDKNIDLLTKEMSFKKRVDDHEERITDLEAGYKTVKSVVTLHSEQLAKS